MPKPYEMPELCPKCGNRFFVDHTRWGQMRFCSNRECTVRQWLDAHGKPKGECADLETRAARMAAHQKLDRIWKEGLLSRGKCYRKLANEFRRAEVHVAEMSIAECERVCEFSEILYRELKSKSRSV